MKRERDSPTPPPKIDPKLLSELGVYLVAMSAGTSLARKVGNLILLRVLLQQAIRYLRESLGYSGTVHVITDCVTIVRGLKDVVAINSDTHCAQTGKSRWSFTRYKWEIGSFSDPYKYLLYIDCDLLVLRPDFLARYFSYPTNIALIHSPTRSPYSHALLDADFSNRTMFDACFILGRTLFIKKLFERCRVLERSHPDTFIRYSDMPILNRAVVDLGLEHVSVMDGIAWAHHTTDYTKSIYHFNAGNLFSKLVRIKRFLARYSRHQIP